LKFYVEILCKIIQIVDENSNFQLNDENVHPVFLSEVISPNRFYFHLKNDILDGSNWEARAEWK
jgi:hypothetical protein